MHPLPSETANLVFDICRTDNHSGKHIKIASKQENEAYIFAARNGVAPWCYHILNKTQEHAVHCTDNFKKQLRMQYLQTLVMNQQKWKVFKELSQLAEKHDISIIPLKGTALAFSVYPQEALRPMGDIDILVHEADIYKFRDIMLQNGAKQLNVPISGLHEKAHAHISALSWQNIMIEPHQRLFATGSIMNLADKNLFDYTVNLQGHKDIRVFDDVMQTYHLATHAFKGYEMGGMRLGWLLDIALILNRNLNDPEFIQKVTALNPKATKQISAPLQWASLLSKKPFKSKFTIPFPDEPMFHAEQNPRQRHKIIVLKEISRLPGIWNKAKMLFREFFPEKTYMDHQYGKHRGLSLFKLYLKRISGL